MKFGYFDDANKEYVITSPRTPYPWINYLGNQGFFSLISNTAGGYSFYKDARLRRNQIKMEPEDEKILAEGKVDYLGFSYYMTNTVKADAVKDTTETTDGRRNHCRRRYNEDK